MTTPPRSAPVPVVDQDSEPFWEAARAGRFVLCRSVRTGRWIHPPQETDPDGGPVRFEEVSGRGEVFSFIVVRRSSAPGFEAPYVVGLIELAEQPGLRITAIIDADPEDVSVGAAVRARMAPMGNTGFSAPHMELVPAE